MTETPQQNASGEGNKANHGPHFLRKGHLLPCRIATLVPLDLYDLCHLMKLRLYNNVIAIVKDFLTINLSTFDRMVGIDDDRVERWLR